jgi:hypothetical protein
MRPPRLALRPIEASKAATCNGRFTEKPHPTRSCAKQRGVQRATPPQARWKADNYNHLLEQPTLFYAVTLSLVVLGASGAINTALAWSYVALRIAHSLVQATTNVIMIRFSIFIISSIVLLVLTLRAAMLVY